MEDTLGIANLACGMAPGVQLSHMIDSDVLDLITTDTQWVRRSLLNLISNAFRATVHGTVKLRVAVHGTADHPRSKLRFTVTDTGSGLDPAVEDLIFKPFVSGQGSIGLGLFLVQQQSKALCGGCGLGPNPSGPGCEAWFEIAYEPVAEVDGDVRCAEGASSALEDVVAVTLHCEQADNALMSAAALCDPSAKCVDKNTSADLELPQVADCAFVPQDSVGICITITDQI